mgnify:CR=1 FL=1
MELNFMDRLLESGGELLGGVVDTAKDFGGDWVGIKLNNELDRASANPSESQTDQNEYQQPDGDVIVNKGPLPSTPWLIGGSVALLVLIIVVFLIMRGR